MTALARTTRLMTMLIAIAALALAVTGCGGDDEQTKTYGDTPVGEEQKVKVDPEAEFNAEQQAVIETLGEFGDATEQGDYKKLCEEIFTEESSKIGGGNCEAFLKKRGTQIDDFSITVESVTIAEDGKSATVKATTTTNGQPTSTPYSLKQNAQGEWQVAILGQ